jgi:hypothetical protein
MNSNTKLISGIVISFILISALSPSALSVLAIAPGAGPSVVQSELNIGDQSIRSVSQLYLILLNIIRWVYTAFFIVAVLFILLAAYNFIQGGSNPEKVKTAKSQLKYAVIAIVVALVASGAALVIDRFLASSGSY